MSGWGASSGSGSAEFAAAGAPRRVFATRDDLYRILVYPNITYARNLEADSYVFVVREAIAALNEIRDDLAFTMLLPSRVRSLAAFPNVEQILYSLPTYPNVMRTHFDATELLRLLDWKNRSYDVVWSHLPEHTLQLRNLFYNATNERPVFVGYSHWYEVPENTGYAETMFEANLAGTFPMRECGLNSEWLRSLVLDHAKGYLAPRRVERLGEILTVQYLGTHPAPIDGAFPEPGLIVFNHRANSYTGFDRALDAFDRLWEKRRDFRVAFTLTDVDRPYAHRIRAEGRDAYLRELARAWVGVGTFQAYSAWSVSVMDGFTVGVPYVLPGRFCYPEMVGADFPLLYADDDEFLAKLELVLDSPELRADLSGRVREIASSFSWAERVKPISQMFDDAFLSAWRIGDRSEKYDEVRKLAEGGATKAEIVRAMKWGVSIPFSPYRTRLRDDGIFVPERRL